MSNRIIVSRYDSPCGEIRIGSIGDRLCLCDWQVESHRDLTIRRLAEFPDAEILHGASPVTDMAMRQLDEYFDGTRRTFDIPLFFTGTDFQKAVWQNLLRIPYGETISYKVLSGRIGCPKSVRAVANACGANPISIFAPCHRVIGSDGTLTGYGGGIKAKEYLLKLENVLLNI